MELIADGLLVAGALGAAAYCYVLSARLSRLQGLETGMGGAIAVLSAQVDEMTRALEKARATASAQTATLEATSSRGEAAAARLELLIATLHDLPEPGSPAYPRPAPPVPDRRLRVQRNRAARPMMEAAE